MQKLLKKLGLLIVIISFSSCKSPEKPSVFSGIVIAEMNEIYYYNDSTGEEYSQGSIVQDCLVNPDLHKSIVHTNEDWNKILLYIRLLENELPRRRRRNLRQARKTYQVLEEQVEAYGF